MIPDDLGGPKLITGVLIRGRRVKVRRRPCNDGSRVRKGREPCQHLDQLTGTDFRLAKL